MFPETVVQTCMLCISSATRCSSRPGKSTRRAKALRPIYGASSAEAAADALDEFEQGPRDQEYPPIVANWRRKWERVVPFFAFSADVRKIIDTTNAIESLHSQVRKTLRNKGHFPSDEAATKLIYLSSQRRGEIETSAERVTRRQVSTRDTIRRALHARCVKLSNGSHTEIRTRPVASKWHYLCLRSAGPIRTRLECEQVAMQHTL